MLIPRSFRLSRTNMLDFLDKLALVEEGAMSLYLPQGVTIASVQRSVELPHGIGDMPPTLGEAINRSATGAVLFWGLARKYLVLPPFPIKDEHTAKGYDVEPLRLLLNQDFLIALVLVRLGAYGIGICQGTNLLDSRIGTGLVHARHRQGGSSQARFARHREKQIQYFLDRICRHVRERIEPYAQSLDYLVYGGARPTILSLRKRCLFLRQFENRILRVLLDIPEPRQTVLENVLHKVWSTAIIEWCEDDL